MGLRLGVVRHRLGLHRFVRALALDAHARSSGRAKGNPVTPQSRNRILAVAALAVAGAGLAYVAAGNIGENLVYYWSPGEMLAQGRKAYGATIRLGGVVKPGTIEWDSGKTHLMFAVADSHKPDAKFVKVDSKEVPPQMFREGIGVVVEGTLARSGVFTSNRLMVNHSNEYRPPSNDEPPKDMKSLIESSVSATERQK
jgi:cytochrome c-type biogenesis protein CcmE